MAADFSAAIAWLQCNEGEGAERESCQAAALFLQQEARKRETVMLQQEARKRETVMLRRVAKRYGVTLEQLRERLNRARQESSL